MPTTPRMDMSAMSEVFCQMSLPSMKPVTGRRLGACGMGVTDGSSIGTSVTVSVIVGALPGVGVAVPVGAADEPPPPDVLVLVGGIAADVGMLAGSIMASVGWRVAVRVGVLSGVGSTVALISAVADVSTVGSTVATWAETAGGTATCQQARATTKPMYMRTRV